MLKMTIDNEEVVSDKDITINEEMLSASSTILNNVYPKEWEEDKDYTSKFYYPQDYSKALIQRSYVTQEAEAGTTIQVNGSVTLTDVDTTKNSRVLRLLGQTSQTGTPTPNSPIPVKVVSGDNEIVVNGKNLVTYSNLSGSTLLGINSSYNNSEFTLNGTTTGTGACISAYSKLNITIPAGTYTYSLRVKSGTNSGIGNGKDIALFLKKDEGTGSSSYLAAISIGQLNANNGVKSITFTVGTPTTLYIYGFANSSAITFNDYVLEGQLEKGSSATTYEPYQSNTYNIDLGVENKFNKDQWYSQRSFLFSSNRATMSEDGTITSILPSAMDFAINLIPSMSATATQTQINQVNAVGFDISNLENITISLKNANSCKGQILTIFYKADYGYISVAQQDFTESNVVKTFDVPSNAKYLCLRFDNESYNTTPTILKIEDIQIEAGTKANAYTPYGTTPIELCKIGTYQDYIYKDSDKWYLHKEIGKVVLNGSENWEGSTTKDITQVFHGLSITPNKLINNNNSFNNYFIVDNPGDTEKIAFGGINDIYIALNKTTASTLAQLKSWLSTHNVTLYYILSTPTNTEITYAELLNQLNALSSQ